MTAIKSTYCRLLVNEFDFSGVSNSLEVALQSDRQDVTCFQDTAKVFLNLGGAGTIAQKGYLSDVIAGEFEKEIQESIANVESLYVAALFGTATAACPAYVARATNTEGMKIAAPVEGVLTLEGSWFEGSGIKRGLRAYTGTISATGAQTHIDLGAAGAAGGYAWLFVQAITGSAEDAVITVESDDNTGFSSAATEATFTFSAVGGNEQAMSGAIDRYVRLNCTDLGGATNFTVVLIVAVSGITY